MTNAKLGTNYHHLIIENSSLWAQTLAHKYGGGSVSIDNINHKKGASRAWLGITSAAKVLRKGMRSRVSNGRSTFF